MGAKHSREAKAKPKPWRGWLSVTGKAQESRISWGSPFRGECPVHGTVGRTSCFEGQVST